MTPQAGFIRLKYLALVFVLSLSLLPKASCQKKILDSIFIFHEGIVKTGNALDIISKRSAYKFTYDSRLIDVNNKVNLEFEGSSLRSVIIGIIQNDSLTLSVIDKYIIISKRQQTNTIGQGNSEPGQMMISGKVTDEETGDPLPYATISIRNRNRGTVSNNNGIFVLNIPGDAFSDTLIISYLGYTRRELTVDQATGSFLTIAMKRDFISIPEIIIRNQIPQEIIRKALHAIPTNYGNTPATLTGFYREGVMKKNELQNYSEAVLQIFKSSYTPTLLNDQVKVYKSRKIENLDRGDTLAIRLKAGLSTCLELDGVRNLFDFISPGSFQDYNYRLTDIVKYDDESAYAIEFEQNEWADMPLFKGTIFINTSDFGICEAEFEINPKMIEQVKESFITGPSRGFNTWPVSVKYKVSYRKSNGRYYLSHVRGDLQFSSRQKRRLFHTQFLVFFELAVTHTDIENVKRFDRDELAPIHDIFSKTINSYDQSFWGDQDFLRPEDNLLQSLKNMKVKLQEFNK